jgi:hypothetical protein
MTKGKMFFTMNEDGSADIGYNDYDVEDLGGCDYEATYTFNAKNFALLLEKIGCPDKSKAEEYIIKVFGEYLDKLSFGKYCDANKIRYKVHTWIG